MHEQGSWKMFKKFIQNQKVAEKLLIIKLSNNMMNPVQLKMLILHNGFLYWSGHNLAFDEARIKIMTFLDSELSGLLKNAQDFSSTHFWSWEMKEILGG